MNHILQTYKQMSPSEFILQTLKVNLNAYNYKQVQNVTNNDLH